MLPLAAMVPEYSHKSNRPDYKLSDNPNLHNLSTRSSQSSSDDSTASQTSLPPYSSTHTSQASVGDVQSSDIVGDRKERGAFHELPSIFTKHGEDSSILIAAPSEHGSPISQGPIGGAGHKRTATGDVKISEASLTASPVDGVRQRHSRNTSIASNESSIGELSSQLKARLSYAMVKVQHGWESRTIDEIENLAFRGGSSISTVPSAHLPLKPFPSTGSSPACVPLKNQAESKPRQRSLSNLSAQNRTLPSNRSIPMEPSASTYHNSQPSISNAPHLAPAVDIQARNPRRSNHLPLQPPSLNTSPVNNLSATGMSPPYHVQQQAHPSTPPPRFPITTSTSPHKSTTATAEEKDAIETLMFMSSPGNSGYHPPYQSQPPSHQYPGTSLRNQYLQPSTENQNISPGKKVGFATALTADATGQKDATMTSGARRNGKRRSLIDNVNLGDDRAIDALLDRMSSASESSDDGKEGEGEGAEEDDVNEMLTSPVDRADGLRRAYL